MRVLAFDPGYERLGIAVVEKIKDKEILVASACVRTSAKLSFPERLAQLGSAAEEFINKYSPDAVAIEELYFEKNVKTAMQVAQVAGMLTYVASARKIRIFHYTPLQVKVATTGYGKSDKAAVAAMVGRLVTLPAKTRLDDEIDAIAVGITCLASAR